MNWTHPALMCLAFVWPVVSCTTGRGHARIIDTDAPPPAVGAVVPVRASPESPLRDAPFYFAEQQREAAGRLSAPVRDSYERFCRQMAYPRLGTAWCNPGVCSAAGPAQVIVSLGCQRGVLLVDGRVALDFPVCTGAAGHATPAGNYHVLEKDPQHRSNLYDNAPMFCFMRLTWDGIGMHIGPVEKSPASHGCIRLPGDACRRLFARVPVGTPVSILP